MAADTATALIGLAGAVIGGGISSLTTVIVAKAQREKFRQERSWDLRRATYAKVIGALDRARAITEYINDGYIDDPHTWDVSAANKKAQEQMVEHFHAAMIEFHASRLKLSHAFVVQYEKMSVALGEANKPNLISLESAGIAAAVMKRALPSLEALAKQELGIDL